MTYQVSQETANEILYEAYTAYMLDKFLFDKQDIAYKTYHERAKAMYQAWSMITNIEFQNGIYDLEKFTDDDFADVISKQYREMFEEIEDIFPEARYML